MLTLSRKIGEKILVGDDIVIELVQIIGDKVRIGVTAPLDVLILRAELAARAVPFDDEETVDFVRPADTIPAGPPILISGWNGPPAQIEDIAALNRATQDRVDDEVNRPHDEGRDEAIRERVARLRTGETAE